MLGELRQLWGLREEGKEEVVSVAVGLLYHGFVGAEVDLKHCALASSINSGFTFDRQLCGFAPHIVLKHRHAKGVRCWNVENVCLLLAQFIINEDTAHTFGRQGLVRCILSLIGAV